MLRSLTAIILALTVHPALATVADCAGTDRSDVESVWRCMASYRAAPGGQNLFANTIGHSDCGSLSSQYLDALRKSGLRFRRKEQVGLLPTCKTFAKAVQKFTGEPPWWNACLGTPDTGEHLKKCLLATAKGYYGRKLETLGGCEGLVKAYGLGLKSASNFRQMGVSHKDAQLFYGAALQGLDCGKFQAILQTEAPKAAAAWGPCMNYAQDKEAAHVTACIGNRTIGLTDCRKVRNLYEQKLKAANGGIFPPGYVAMNCKSAEAVIQAELQRMAEARKKHEEEMAALRAAQAQRANVSWGDVGKAMAGEVAAWGKWVNNLAGYGIRSVLDGVLPGDQSGWGLSWLVTSSVIIGFLLWAAFKLGSKLAWEWVKRKVFRPR